MEDYERFMATNEAIGINAAIMSYKEELESLARRFLILS